MTIHNRVRWSPRDVILYHLGVGAGSAPDYAGELRYVSEDDLLVLPTFALIPGMPDADMIAALVGIAGDVEELVQVEQEIVVHGAIPAAAEASVALAVAEVHDQRDAAVVVVESTVTDCADGEALATGRASFAVPRSVPVHNGHARPTSRAAPQRRPDAQFTMVPDRRQALVYRFCGDSGRIAAEPPGSEHPGFARQIVHGRCVYGSVCKAVVDNLLGGKADAVARYCGRFAGIAYAGEALVVCAWEESDRILLEVHAAERGKPVMTEAAVELRDGPWTGAWAWHVTDPPPWW